MIISCLWIFHLVMGNNKKLVGIFALLSDLGDYCDIFYTFIAVWLKLV